MTRSIRNLLRPSDPKRSSFRPKELIADEICGEIHNTKENRREMPYAEKLALQLGVISLLTMPIIPELTHGHSFVIRIEMLLVAHSAFQFWYAFFVHRKLNPNLELNKAKFE